MCEGSLPSIYIPILVLLKSSVDAALYFEVTMLPNPKYGFRAVAYLAIAVASHACAQAGVGVEYLIGTLAMCYLATRSA